MFVRYRVVYFKIGNFSYVNVFDYQTKKTTTYELQYFWRMMADEFSHNGGFVFGGEDSDVEEER